MYKSRLQELCQKKNWELPVYTTGKNGPCHVPRFTATVTLQGQVFETPEEFKSVKEAQNTAARIAFDHFNVPSPAEAVNSQVQTGAPPPLPVAAPVGQPPVLLPLSPLPSSLPNPPPGLLRKKNDANTKPANGEVMQENSADTQTPVDNMIAIDSHDKGYKAGLSMYKNQLQQYAQKEDLGFPVYSTEAQGPPHDRRFKSRVCVNGKSYETTEFFPTLKEAEQAVAKVACQALSVDVIQEDVGLYKNLLQEFAQKKGLRCPSYETVSSGMSHSPVFVSVVAVGTNTFQGAEAKTKKQAEMNAAKVAYFDLTKVTNSTVAPTITECRAADNLSQNVQPTTTIKNYHDATNEDPDLHAKRAKSSTGDMNVVPPSFHPGQPSHDRTLENQPEQQWKTVVLARELNWPIPENAIVLPCSDEKWVAFKVGVGKDSTA
ncbi:hypothetical protein ACS0TY_026515 [Phlomoides rotata]